MSLTRAHSPSLVRTHERIDSRTEGASKPLPLRHRWRGRGVAVEAGSLCPGDRNRPHSGPSSGQEQRGVQGPRAGFRAPWLSGLRDSVSTEKGAVRGGALGAPGWGTGSRGEGDGGEKGRNRGDRQGAPTRSTASPSGTGAGCQDGETWGRGGSLEGRRGRQE